MKNANMMKYFVVLSLAVAALLFIWFYQGELGFISSVEQKWYCTFGIIIVASLGLILMRNSEGIAELFQTSQRTPTDDDAPDDVLASGLLSHLKTRHGLLWRNKIRILLVVG
ncbi:MAG: hypothetical protein L0K83_06140, partial [Lactobacillus sp.]|nr:hypothetical protein [Lactobacillus sp.]